MICTSSSAVCLGSRGVWQLHRDLEALFSLILREFDLLQNYISSHPDDAYHASYWSIPEVIALREEIDSVRRRIVDSLSLL